ncbi:MAG: hypothetical protein BECKG1743E_GA0114224_112313, partial [Candidatus Kentron sp. G]
MNKWPQNHHSAASRKQRQGSRNTTIFRCIWGSVSVKSHSVTARVISGVASHIQVEETEALHVSRIALMVRGYLRSECVKELLS